MKYLLHKLVLLLPVLVGISLISFLLGVISPGDPAELALTRNGFVHPTTEQIEQKRKELGLDQPVAVQYVRWLGKAVRGDLGVSYATREPVAGELARRFPATLSLALMAMAVTCLCAIPVGIIMAAHKDRLFDRVWKVLSALLLSVPAFWLAIFFIFLFSETLHLLPTSGIGSIRHMIMPAVVLGWNTIGVTMRLTRTAVIKELSAQYVLFARAKGLRQKLIVLGHAIPNALPPVVTLLGNYFGGLLGGAAVIEVIFAIPGIGRYAIDSIYARDYPAIQGYVLLVGCVFVLVNLAADVLLYALNPRIRLDAKAQA